MMSDANYGDVYTRVAIGVLFYNEKDGLKRLITNLLKRGVPKDDIICLDGPFDMYPHGNEPKSSDGSIEYLKSKGIKVIDCGIMTHIDKTNARLHVIGKMGYDAMLAVDCDEYILGNWPDFVELVGIIAEKKPSPTYAIPFFDKDGFYDTRQLHQRLFFNLNDLYYEGLHFTVFRKQFVGQIKSNWVIGALSIIHDSSIRSDARNLLMHEFQTRHTESEKPRMNIWNTTQPLNMDLPTRFE